MARTADIWPWPPSIRMTSGQAGKRRLRGILVVGSRLGGSASSGCSCSLISREKRRCITSRIMPKSSPGVISVERMLNLRYWFLTKPSGPATTMRADRVGAHDVRIVVDLDAPRRRRQAEGLGETGEQPRLASRFRPAGGRAPRGHSAGRCRSGPSSRRAAARVIVDLAAGAVRQRLGQQLLLLDGARQQDQCAASACRRRTGPGTSPAPRRARAPGRPCGK